MERKNIILICVALIIAVIVICGAVIYEDSFEDTKISLKKNSVYKDDNITFILKDKSGNPLANKNITVNLTSSKNKTKTYNLTTNSKGVAKLKMKNKGKFTVNAIFEGEGFLKASNLTKKVTVKEKEVPKQTTTTTKTQSSGKYVVERNSCENGRDVWYSNGDVESWGSDGSYSYVHNGKMYYKGPDGGEWYGDEHMFMM